MAMGKRKWISFEGGEGSGKSTQISLLEHYLRSLGETVCSFREPGGTYIGEQIRHLLQHDVHAFAMFPETELLLYEASRAQLVRECILPALEEDKWVLCDRFFDSTTAYQGAARQIPLERVHWLNHFAAMDGVPELTFLFTLPVAIGRQRLEQKNGKTLDRIERESSAFFEAVAEAYAQLAIDHPRRFVVIDAQLDKDHIAQTIRERVHEHFFS
jgi:dTMP kinase